MEERKIRHNGKTFRVNWWRNNQLGITCIDDDFRGSKVIDESDIEEWLEGPREQDEEFHNPYRDFSTEELRERLRELRRERRDAAAQTSKEKSSGSNSKRKKKRYTKSKKDVKSQLKDMDPEARKELLKMLEENEKS